jgi:hypothetical protein
LQNPLLIGNHKDFDVALNTQLGAMGSWAINAAASDIMQVAYMINGGRASVNARDEPFPAGLISAVKGKKEQ